MTTLTRLASEIWRKYVTDGVPASGRNKPDVDEVRVWGTEVEAGLNTSAHAGILLDWDTGTSDADPGNGKIRANNASLASATFLYVDELTRYGSAIETFLTSLDDAANTIKGIAQLTNLSDNKQATFNVTAITDASGYVKIAVSGHSGETSFASGSIIGFNFMRAGDGGADSTFKYNYNSATSGDPGAGKFLFNNATFASATQVNISETDASGNALAALLAKVDDSGSSKKCLVLAIEQGGASAFAFYITSVLTDAGNYDTFTIEPILVSGSIANNDLFGVSFFIVGDVGTTLGNKYQFETATSGDPGSGKLLFNNASFASATSMNISETDADGLGITSLLAAIDNSDSANKCLVFARKKASATIKVWWITSVLTDNGGYDTFSISPVLEAGGAFADDDEIFVAFYPVGDKGDQGVSGGGAFGRVRVVDTSGLDPTTAYQAGDTIDGVVLVEGDLILRAASSSSPDTLALNGVYVAANSLGAAVRHSDYDAYNELAGAYFSVMEGTTNADTLWRCTSDPGGTIDASSVVIEEAQFGGGGREVLTGNRTYYVRADGSDSNTGLVDSAGGGFLTAQKAINVVAALDISTFDVTIQVRTGTFSGAITVNGPWVGTGTVTLLGDTGTPSNVLISTGASDAITVSNNGTLTVSGVKLTNTGNYLLHATNGGFIKFTTVEIGSCSNQQIRFDDGGKVTATGNYTINGGAVNHWAGSGAGSQLRVQSKTVTLSGTPAFSGAFASVGFLACAIVNGDTFSGPATGARFSVLDGGTIYTAGAGATYLPGNAAGSGTNYGASPWGLYD